VTVKKLQFLSPIARRSYYFLLAAILFQVSLGISAVWYPEPIWIANSHQAGAVTILTALVFALHTCRRVDPRHIKNLLGKLRVEDPEGFHRMMGHFNKQVMSKKEYEAAKQHFMK
jgi:hypothetical protein